MPMTMSRFETTDPNRDSWTTLSIPLWSAKTAISCGQGKGDQKGALQNHFHAPQTTPKPPPTNTTSFYRTHKQFITLESPPTHRQIFPGAQSLPTLPPYR